MEARASYSKERLDRARWTFGPGPWNAEPDDEVCWTHPTDGVGCVLRRNSFCGSWVVLVAVPPGHPLFGLDPMDVFPEIIAISGTVYWGHFDYPIPGVGNPGKWWWIGFDTHHPLAPFVSGEDVERRLFAKPAGHPLQAARQQFEQEWKLTYRNETQCKQLLEAFVDRIRGVDASTVAGRKKYAR